MTGNGYAADRLSPARHVASELDRAAPAALSLAELAASYRHPNTADLARITTHEHTDDPVGWLIRDAVKSLTRNGEHGRVQIEHSGDGYRLADGLSFGDLRFERKQLANLRDDHAQFRAPFDPMTGRFAENIRTDKLAMAKDGMDELRESMRALGWVPEFPALRDKRGVFLTGHRRLKVAEELRAEGLDIKDEIKTLEIGDGDEHDARRLRIALASNLGFKPMSPTDRKAIAESLYSDGWTMVRIGEALDVSVGTVHSDLKGFSAPEKPNRPKGGRPRLADKPELHADVGERIESDQPVRPNELARKHGVGRNTVTRAAEFERGRLAAGAPVTDVPTLELMKELIGRLPDQDIKELHAWLGSRLLTS